MNSSIATAFCEAHDIAYHGMCPMCHPQRKEWRVFLGDDGVYRGSYVVFVDGPRSASGKTRTWLVRSESDHDLGVVKWFSSWRKYCYFPADDTAFEQTCLREIAQFIQDRTEEHRR